MLLRIKHLTVYQYQMPVQFERHRLMIRPLEGHECQIRSSELTIQPSHKIRWLHDVFGNSVAQVEFLERSARLVVESKVLVEQYNTNPFDFVLEPYAVEVPFQYADTELDDVTPFIRCQYPKNEKAVREWARPFLNVRGRARTLDFLTSLNRSVPLSFTYVRREEPGVQTPAQTLKLRSGSCRDFAVLMMEAARQLGLATRFVSGYLCQSGTIPAEIAEGATHAWMEAYLPGAGWKGFDPTCGMLAADFHVRVAVTRSASQAVPVSGTYVGGASANCGMEVIVSSSIEKP